MKEKDGRNSLQRAHDGEKRGGVWEEKSKTDCSSSTLVTRLHGNPYGRTSHLGNSVLAALELLTCGRSWALHRAKAATFLRSGHQTAKNSEKHKLLISGSLHCY